MENKSTVKKCIINNGHIGFQIDLSYLVKEEVELENNIKGLKIINDFGEEQLVPEDWFINE